MSDQHEPSDEELRAAYEAELSRITVADIVVQTAASLINMAGMRLGMGGPEAAPATDLAQARDAIDAVRGLMPVIERHPGPHVRQLREAITQLQFVYSREIAADPAAAPAPPSPSADQPPSPPAAAAPPPTPAQGGPGPAQSSGRLWIPGQR
jgi:hypothetical protein